MTSNFVTSTGSIIWAKLGEMDHIEINVLRGGEHSEHNCQQTHGQRAEESRDGVFQIKIKIILVFSPVTPFNSDQCFCS